MAKDDIVEAEPQGPTSDHFMSGLVVITTVALVVAFWAIKSAHGHIYLEGFLKP